MIHGSSDTTVWCDLTAVPRLHSLCSTGLCCFDPNRASRSFLRCSFPRSTCRWFSIWTRLLERQTSLGSCAKGIFSKGMRLKAPDTFHLHVSEVTRYLYVRLGSADTWSKHAGWRRTFQAFHVRFDSPDTWWQIKMSQPRSSMRKETPILQGENQTGHQYVIITVGSVQSSFKPPCHNVATSFVYRKFCCLLHSNTFLFPFLTDIRHAIMWWRGWWWRWTPV